jgi:hypothetical protein
MDTSLYVLRNDANANTFRHETLDEALEALNYEVGARDLWVLIELDRAGAGRLVAEGRGHIRRTDAHEAPVVVEGAVDDETAFEWRRLVDRRRN